MPRLSAVNADDVRRRYYDTLGAEQAWWWIRSMYVEPNELIVEDDEGELFRVEFTVEGETVTFGEARSVRVQYVEAMARGGLSRAVAAVAQRGRILASYDSRKVSRPSAERERIAPDAARDEVIGAAVAARKIRASDRAGYERMWASDQVTARRLLTAPIEEGGLAPGIVARSEAGGTVNDDETYDMGMLTHQERARIEAARGGRPPEAVHRTTTVTGARPPVQEIGRGDRDGDAYPQEWLDPAERAAVNAGAARAPPRITIER
jgi:hypothetical protein